MKKIKDKQFIITVFSLFLFTIVILLPFIPLMFTSVAYNFRWPDIIPIKFTGRALKYVFFHNPSTYEAIFNTVVIGISIIILDLIMAIPAAYALVRYEFKGKVIIKMLLFAPIIVPPFTAIMGMYTVFIMLGLTESILGVILANILPTLPYMIKALMICFSTIDISLEEQAKVLGANPLKRFYYVTLPHILPGIFAGASLTFLISASQYFLTFLVGGGKVLTLIIIMFPFINGGDRAIGSVYSLIFSLMALINILLFDLILRNYYKRKNFKII